MTTLPEGRYKVWTNIVAILNVVGSTNVCQDFVIIKKIVFYSECNLVLTYNKV